MAKDLEPIDPDKFLPAENEELITDLSYVRNNQYSLIEKAQKALDQLLVIAESSQHPRAYEGVVNLLKTTSELNKDLVDTAEKKATVKETGTDVRDGQVINNNVFVGTTNDLLNLLNKGEKPPQSLNDDDT